MEKIKLLLVSNFFCGLEIERNVKKLKKEQEIEITRISIEQIMSIGSEQQYDMAVLLYNADLEFSDYICRMLDEQSAYKMKNAIIRQLENAFFHISQWTNRIYIGVDNSHWNIGGKLFSYNVTSLQFKDRQFTAEIYQQFYDRAEIIDIGMIIAELGLNHVYDSKKYYRWRCPYSDAFFRTLFQKIFVTYEIAQGRLKKCIVLDCDNVLWGGEIAEQGIDKIILGNIGEGKKYQDFQQLLKTLYQFGVVLCLCSKNDEKDIQTVFDNHTAMVLNSIDIADKQISWDAKWIGILNISKSLNISLDQIVFVDDSIHEIKQVEEKLPEVSCIHFDINHFWELLDSVKLPSKYNVQSVKERQSYYQWLGRQTQGIGQDNVQQTYLQELETKVTLTQMKEEELFRIAELSLRTNRCTIGERLSYGELKKKLQEGTHEMYSIYVQDKLHDFGLMGGIMIQNGMLEFFSLSCRVLGRNVEETILEQLKEKIQKCHFIATTKNEKLKDVLKEYSIAMV